MCRNIKVLYNFDPPSTKGDVQEAALQFVRKISGFREPSQANEVAFNRAVQQIAKASEELLSSLKTKAPPHDRAEFEAAAKQRALERFGK